MKSVTSSCFGNFDWLGQSRRRSVGYSGQINRREREIIGSSPFLFHSNSLVSPSNKNCKVKRVNIKMRIE